MDCVETSATSVTVEWTSNDTSKLSSWKVKIFPKDEEYAAVVNHFIIIIIILITIVN